MIHRRMERMEGRRGNREAETGMAKWGTVDGLARAGSGEC